MNEMDAVRRENGNDGEDAWESWCDGWEYNGGWDMCRDFWQTDRFDDIGWAALLLWAAALVASGNMGLAERFIWWDGWSLFLTGAGVIVLGKIVARTFSPYRRRSEMFGVVFGLFLIGIGLAGLSGGGFFLPLFLAAIAGYVLFRAFARR